MNLPKGNGLIVAVAPVAHDAGDLPKESRNPMTSHAVAAEVIRCWDAGASLVHLHVRDEAARQVSDLRVFSRTIDLIRDSADIIIQGSTGGLSSLSLEDRCACLGERRVETASLNLGSVNLAEDVYINTLPDIRYWAQRMKDTNTLPEIEIFNPSMIETAYALVEEGVLEEPLHFNFALGFPASLSAAPRHLFHLASMLPPGAVWGLIHNGMVDFTLVATAVGLGATVVRVGFEDSGYYANRRAASTNAEMVEAVVKLARMIGRDVVNSAEARRLLELPPLRKDQ